MSEKTTYRTPRDKPYFSLNRATAQDENLSFEARGLLAYLLSKPDDWKVILSDVQRNGNIGRDKARRLLKELESAGYIKKEDQTINPDGTFGNIPYRIYETKQQPCTENPSTVNPSTENPTLHSTESTDITPNGVSTDTSTDEKPKPQRSEKQLANDALVKALGVAYGVEASNGEYANYLKIAQRLTKDISAEQFTEYVKFVRQMAIRDGWTFTLNSLTSDKLNPMSLYLAKDKTNPNQPKTRREIALERLAQGLPYNA
jgi:hypothetical protein